MAAFTAAFATFVAVAATFAAAFLIPLIGALTKELIGFRFVVGAPVFILVLLDDTIDC